MNYHSLQINDKSFIASVNTLSLDHHCSKWKRKGDRTCLYSIFLHNLSVQSAVVGKVPKLFVSRRFIILVFEHLHHWKACITYVLSEWHQLVTLTGHRMASRSRMESWPTVLGTTALIAEPGRRSLKVLGLTILFLFSRYSLGKMKRHKIPTAFRSRLKFVSFFAYILQHDQNTDQFSILKLNF